MKIIITRHGQTNENVSNTLQGHTYGTLSPHGIMQAKKLSQRLKDHEFTCIYSSDLKRAANTTKEIVTNHPETPVKLVSELRERSLGELEGTQGVDVIWSEEEQKMVFIDSKNGESVQEMQVRAERFLHQIIEEHAEDSTLLLVCHGRIGMALITAIKGLSHTDIDPKERLHNTSISIFTVDNDKNHSMEEYNCVHHLN